MDLSGKILGDSGDQGHFAVFRQAQGNDAGAKFLPQAIDELAEALPVDISFMSCLRSLATNW